MRSLTQSRAIFEELLPDLVFCSAELCSRWPRFAKWVDVGDDVLQLLETLNALLLALGPSFPALESEREEVLWPGIVVPQNSIECRTPLAAGCRVFNASFAPIAASRVFTKREVEQHNREQPHSHAHSQLSYSRDLSLSSSSSSREAEADEEAEAHQSHWTVLYDRFIFDLSLVRSYFLRLPDASVAHRVVPASLRSPAAASCSILQFEAEFLKFSDTLIFDAEISECFTMAFVGQLVNPEAEAAFSELTSSRPPLVASSSHAGDAAEELLTPANTACVEGLVNTLRALSVFYARILCERRKYLSAKSRRTAVPSAASGFGYGLLLRNSLALEEQHRLESSPLPLRLPFDSDKEEAPHSPALELYGLVATGRTHQFSSGGPFERFGRDSSSSRKRNELVEQLATSASSKQLSSLVAWLESRLAALTARSQLLSSRQQELPKAAFASLTRLLFATFVRHAGLECHLFASLEQPDLLDRQMPAVDLIFRHIIAIHERLVQLYTGTNYSFKEVCNLARARALFLFHDVCPALSLHADLHELLYKQQLHACCADSTESSTLWSLARHKLLGTSHQKEQQHHEPSRSTGHGTQASRWNLVYRCVLNRSFRSRWFAVLRGSPTAEQKALFVQVARFVTDLNPSESTRANADLGIHFISVSSTYFYCRYEYVS